MTTTDQFNERDNVMAAEYVVGVLSAADRQAVTRRASQEADFAALITTWQTHLSGIDRDYGSVPAPEHIKSEIERRLFGAKRRQIWPWLSGAVAASLLFITFIGGWNVTMGRTDLRADLRSSETVFEFAVEVDSGKRGEVVVAAGALPDEQTFELWLLTPEGAPVSLGTFSDSGPLEPSVFNLLTEGATLAVSLEPIGGSPTGAPTGPVLAVGVLEDV